MAKKKNKRSGNRGKGNQGNQGKGNQPTPPSPPPAEPPPPEPTPPVGLPTPHAAAIVAALSVAAVAAMYLLYAYIQVTYSTEAFDSACNFNQTFNCDKLNTSSWGKIAGIPITVFAVPFYLALGALVALARKGGEQGLAAIELVLVGSGLGVVYGLVLLAVMVFVENVYCPFCLTMDAGALVAFVAAWFGRKRMLGEPGRAWAIAFGWAVGVGLVGLVLSFGWFASQRSAGEEAQQAAAEAEDKKTQAELDALKKSGGGEALKATGEARLIAGNLYEVPVRPTDASYGPLDAPVTVVEYADFACGYCKKLTYSLGQMKKRYEGQVRWVFKHFPMNPQCNEFIKNTRHKNACESAVASECARRQGKFWPMHDLMFKNQHKLGKRDLLHYAEEVGLDTGEFNQCLSSKEAKAVVQADIKVGGQLELTGTPRTFVNGRLFKGVAAAAIERAIQKGIGGEGLPEIKRTPPPVVPPPAQVAELPAMTKIEREDGSSFYIDTFEASVDAAGNALSLYGVLPANASWYEAQAACEKAGKRLCTSEEWGSTCQGADAIDDDNSGSYIDDYVEGWQFPYADWHERGWCHDQSDGRTGEPVTTGSKIRCRTESGVYDLGGNVAEWIEVDESKAVTAGGDYGSKDKAGCFRPNRTWGPGHKNKRMGFRCCADTLVPNKSAEAVNAIAREGLEGTKVPAFKGELMKGGEVDSASFVGKVTYLTFFASWCTPCRREFPELSTMQAEYGDRGFQVISVGVDTDPAKSARFARSAGATFPIVLDPKGLIQGQFDIKSMPTTYIIDRQGVIQHKQVGFSPDKTPGTVRPIIEGLL